jgi:hypothetical protein
MPWEKEYGYVQAAKVGDTIVFAHIDNRNEMNSHDTGSHESQFLVRLSQVQYCCPFI